MTGLDTGNVPVSIPDPHADLVPGSGFDPIPDLVTGLNLYQSLGSGPGSGLALGLT